MHVPNTALNRTQHIDKTTTKCQGYTFFMNRKTLRKIANNRHDRPQKQVGQPKPRFKFDWCTMTFYSLSEDEISPVEGEKP